MAQSFQIDKTKKITCILITEKRHGLEIKEFDDYDFMGDGIIFLDKAVNNNIETFLISVLKMRATNTNSFPRDFRFTNKGIELY